MKPFPVPVLGDASLASAEGPQVSFAPGRMETFQRPPRSTPKSEAAQREAVRLLSSLLDRMRAEPFVAWDGTGGGAVAPFLSLLHASREVVDEVNDLLGQGEVSCRIDGPRPVHIQETSFPSVWRVQVLAPDGALVDDRVETGAFPAAAGIPASPFRGAVEPGPEREGLMNSPALIREILHRAERWRPGDPAHVVNLTLLPVTPQDLQYLGDTLGRGPIGILSRGYGSCRIGSTRLGNVWWVQHFHNMGQMILNTIEIVDLPIAAQAAVQDYEDSCERLGEWLAAVED
ncbi:HupH hydrogenase expression protein, C-terminal conserved region [Burkholderiales bacterium GJ-E10]|nr:HupH hydrogenase expression protein, C-terminal conserved region [Burkholderiales bacterium GJ-E10]